MVNYPTNNAMPSYSFNRNTFAAGQSTHIRPVSSIEEVRAAAVDFDGTVFFFPDFSNKRIYTKQINVDGTAQLNMYELTDLPVVNETTYVTREEFNSTLLEIKDSLAKLNTSPKPAEPEKTSSVMNF